MGERHSFVEEFASEQMDEQSITEGESKSLDKLNDILLKVDTSDNNMLEELSMARIDMFYADGAKKLKKYPNNEYQGLRYDSLSPKQQEFIDGVVMAVNKYEEEEAVAV